MLKNQKGGQKSMIAVGKNNFSVIMISVILLTLALIFTAGIDNVSAATAADTPSDTQMVTRDNSAAPGTGQAADLSVTTSSKEASGTADQKDGQTGTQKNTQTKTSKTNTSKPNQSSNSVNQNEGQTLPDPQIYKDGVPVSRGGHPAGYVFDTIAHAITDALSGDTIMLEDGRTFYERLTISKSLTFDVFNSGHATINGSAGGRVININTSGLTVIFNNITITNGRTNSQGAGIYNNGSTLIVNGCTFTSNTSTGGNGGGISVAGNGSLTVNNSTFTSNTATSGNGGAIYFNGTGTFNVTGGTFNSNTARNGGAIYSNRGNWSVSGSNFTSNTATRTNSSDVYGGAIYNYSSSGTLTVNNSTFTGNTARSGSSNDAFGGAVASNGPLTVNIGNFDSNHSVSSSGTSNDDGGAIWTRNSLNITNSIFNNNDAGEDGGAINIGNESTGGISVSITGSNFTNNRSGWGGAIWINGGTSTNRATITNNTFTGNNATYGGAIRNWGYLTLTSNTITGNSATYGIISNLQNNSEIHFNRIVGNTGSYDIYLEGGSVNAENNWWGSNANPSGRVYGSVDVDPWLMLRAYAAPDTIYNGQTSIITADLTWNSNNVQPTGGFVPNGITADFDCDSKGDVDPESNTTTDGKATTTFTALASGISTVSATVDSQTVYTTVTINPVANITITVGDNTVNGKANPGNLVTFTITLHNNGPDDAHNVVLTVVLPMGLQYWSSPDPDVSYNHDTRTITWSGIGTMVNDADVLRSFVVQVNKSMSGESRTVNAAETHTEYPGTSTANRSLYAYKSEVTVTVTDNVDHKAYPGDLVIFTVTLHNNGPDPAQNVYLKVMPLNMGLTYITSDGGVYNPTGRTIIWENLGTIASGADLIKTFTVKILNVAGKDIPVTVTQRNDAESSPNGTDTINVKSKKSPVTVTVTDNTTDHKANVGDLVIFTVTLHNNGPDPAQNVYLKVMPLNCGLTYISSDGGVYNPAGRTIIWENLGTIASGADLIKTFTVKILNVAGKDIPVTVHQKNDAQPNSKGTDSIYVKKSTLNMIMTDDTTGGQAHVGDLVTFTITIHNAGPDQADNVTLKELPLNYGFDFVSSSGGTYDPSLRTIVWNVGTITSGGDAILTFTVRVNSTALGQSITNTAAATQSGYSTNPQATDTINIIS